MEGAGGGWRASGGWRGMWEGDGVEEAGKNETIFIKS